jgi:hypothetical protein
MIAASIGHLTSVEAAGQTPWYRQRERPDDVLAAKNERRREQVLSASVISPKARSKTEDS